MWIRYKNSQRDNVPAHVREFGGVARIVFLDAHGGLADVRDRFQIEALLRDPSKRYEMAYEYYGVAFDAQGRQIAPAETVNGLPLSPGHPPLLIDDSPIAVNPMPFKPALTHVLRRKPKR